MLPRISRRSFNCILPSLLNTRPAVRFNSSIPFSKNGNGTTKDETAKDPILSNETGPILKDSSTAIPYESNTISSNDLLSKDEQEAMDKRTQEDIHLDAEANEESDISFDDVKHLLLNKDCSDLTTKEKELQILLKKMFKTYAQDNQVFKPIQVSNSSASHDAALPNFSQKKQYPNLIPSSRNDPYTTQELFLRQLNHSSHNSNLGGNIENIYFPHKDIFNPPLPEDVTMNQLIAAGVHLGQSTSLWRSSTQPFIYGKYRGIHLIDLSQTLIYLKRAAKVVEKVSENGGIILFIGTRTGQKRPLEQAAKRSHGYCVTSRWIPGTLTNSSEISSTSLRKEIDISDKDTHKPLTAEETTKMIKPDLLVILNPTENRNALSEAMKARVPTIGIIDTDSEPSLVTYPIPGNDDSTRSVSLLLGVLAKAGERGVKTRIEMNKKNTLQQQGQIQPQEQAEQQQRRFPQRNQGRKQYQIPNQS